MDYIFENKKKVVIPMVKFKDMDFSKLLNDDNVDYDELSKFIEMKKKVDKIKKIHPYPINHSDASGYFTYVADNTAKKGMKLIRRSNEDSLMSALCEWYFDNSKKKTLKEVFDEWIEWKTTPRNKSNIKRLQATWKSYYGNEPLSKELLKIPMSSITTLMLRQWAESLLKKNSPVDIKKFYRMFNIINQCYEYASDEDIGYVQENLWQKAKKKINRDLIVSNPVPFDEEQVYQDNEQLKLKELVYADLGKYKKQPTSAGLQILFLFETGLRIGECCGLKWTDIKGRRLYLRRQADNDGVKEWTKSNAGYRDIPLTDEALEILEMVKQYNAEHGFDKEWIFQSNNPKYDYRLSYNSADRKLRKLCKRLDTVIKSPHKCRKTCISTLLDSAEINSRSVQRFAGHKDLSTTLKYYSFERKSKEEVAIQINEALSMKRKNNENTLYIQQNTLS